MAEWAEWAEWATTKSPTFSLNIKRRAKFARLFFAFKHRHGRLGLFPYQSYAVLPNLCLNQIEEVGKDAGSERCYGFTDRIPRTGTAVVSPLVGSTPVAQEPGIFLTTDPAYAGYC